MTVNKRGILFTIHHPAGLFTGLFILLMSLSGSVLIFRHELDQKAGCCSNFLSPALPVDSVYRLIRQYYPHAQISSCNSLDGPTDPLSFSFMTLRQNGEKALEVFCIRKTGKRFGKPGRQ